MPRVIENSGLMVRCANCGHEQPDEGKRATCVHCGCQPVPSYAYSKDCAFYPRPRREDQQKRIERAVALRRGELGR